MDDRQGAVDPDRYKLVQKANHVGKSKTIQKDTKKQKKGSWSLSWKS